jgi:hypothetical protein
MLAVYCCRVPAATKRDSSSSTASSSQLIVPISPSILPSTSFAWMSLDPPFPHLWCPCAYPHWTSPHSSRLSCCIDHLLASLLPCPASPRLYCDDPTSKSDALLHHSSASELQCTNSSYMQWRSTDYGATHSTYALGIDECSTLRGRFSLPRSPSRLASSLGTRRSSFLLLTFDSSDLATLRIHYSQSPLSTF